MENNSGVKKYLLLVVGVMIVGMLGWFMLSYNGLVTKEEQVKTAWSQVESNLQRKIDLLPNLVRVVKAYASHEKEVYENITALRSNALATLKEHQGKTDKESIKAIAEVEKSVNGSVFKLFAVAENYPDLRSSEQFLQLQSQIEGTENRLNITRMQFNETVGVFNHSMRTIPNNIIAAIAGFKRKAYFKVKSKQDTDLLGGL